MFSSEELSHFRHGDDVLTWELKEEAQLKLDVVLVV